MRVLFTNSALDLRAGSELYLLDLARRLKRRGFELSAFSTRLGEVAAELRSEGVEVVERLDALRAAPDLIHGQHHLETMMALLHFPRVPALFVCHGAVPWEEMPPRFPRLHRYVAVDVPTRERLRGAGIDEGKIVQILNFVDLERFRPRPPLPTRPRRALALSNRASEASFLPVLRSACERRGIALDVAGVDSGRATSAPETLLPGYDLVFAKARSALEAMATGCAVILCDASGLGPLVTPEGYDWLRPLNFGYLTLDGRHDAERVIREIDRYDAGAALRVAERVRAEAGIEPAIERYAEIYRTIVADARPSQAANPTDSTESDTERRATVTYLRRVRETLPSPSPHSAPNGAELRSLRQELEILRGSRAFRFRRWILEHPLARGLYSLTAAIARRT